jgi:hypothetical protein
VKQSIEHGIIKAISVARGRIFAVLPRLPEVGDNAAMQTEPPNAAPPKRKRRWYQFTLRSLMIVVTATAAACAWVAHEGRVVQERRALRQWIEEGGGACANNDLAARIPPVSKINEPSIVRRWLGDQTVATVFLPRKFADQDLQRIKTCFRGATLIYPGADGDSLR